MKTTLYLGTNPAHFPAVGHLVHYPVIRIVPRDVRFPELKQAYDLLEEYTHLIFTSKNAVETFFLHMRELEKKKSVLEGKTIIAIGHVTERYLVLHGLKVDITAEEETQEGVVEALQTQDLGEAFIFLPRSSLSRDALTLFLQEQGVRFLACDLYDTLPQKLEPIPDLAHVDEIVFTSPSTVDAFLQIYGRLPEHKILLALGPITEERLKVRGSKHQKPNEEL